MSDWASEGVDKWSPEKMKARKEILWKYLNEKMGIYTMEEFEAACAKTPKLDLRFLTQKPITKTDNPE